MHLSLSIFWGSREKSRNRQSLGDSLTHLALDADLMGRMAEKGEGIVTTDGGCVMGTICCMVEGRRWRWWK